VIPDGELLFIEGKQKGGFEAAFFNGVH